MGSKVSEFNVSGLRGLEGLTGNDMEKYSGFYITAWLRGGLNG